MVAADSGGYIRSMRHQFMIPAVFTVAGFAAGISLVLSCSGLEETTSSAAGLEDTCSAWRVNLHYMSDVPWDAPPGETPFSTHDTNYVFTRQCLD